jgi:RNA polymerase sigma factor (sigma-70 family)
MRADVSAAFTQEHDSGLRVPARLLRLASDERLVERVRDGSEAAFEAIFDRHHRGILAFCRHMLGSVEEAEDAVQHTFLAAFRELVGSSKPIQLKPWLYTIARNRCLTTLRTRSRQAMGEVTEPPTEHLAAEVERRHDLRDLLRDVAGLPEDQRAALVLSELGDMAHDEIAAVLDCRREKVKALVFQARTSLIASREARETPCADIREQLANLRGGSLRRTELRRHLRDCAGCREFREQVREQRRDLAVVLPVAPTVGLKAAVVGSAGAGAGVAGGAVSGSVAAKVLVVAVLATGGTVAVEETQKGDPPAPRHSRPAAVTAPAVRAVSPPAATTPKPASTVAPGHAKKAYAPAKKVTPAKKTPPGHAKKRDEAAKKVPPGQAKKGDEAAKNVAPGQAKKTYEPAKTPPGQAKKAEKAPKALAPGQAKKLTAPAKPLKPAKAPAQAKKIEAPTKALKPAVIAPADPSVAANGHANP